MQTTDMSEKGLESLIEKSLLEEAHYEKGFSKDYDKTHAIDIVKLLEFLKKTQPEIVGKYNLEQDGIDREKFLSALQSKIEKKGIVETLRKEFYYLNDSITLFYAFPSENNVKAKEMYEQNIFSVTRQLYYHPTHDYSIDMVIFINGLPVITMELKNLITHQNIYNAMKQYREDRDMRDLLFHFGRCMVHFAVDDNEIMMCTHLKNQASWFLPFNKGYNDGAGNPPNPNGVKTDYLWKEILKKDSLTDIIENYAQIIEEENKKTKKKTKKQIFPRYHQLDAVRKILTDVKQSPIGRRYLIQHSAGSGKSNSITWLAHQLVGLERDGHPLFDSIIVVTDRRNLDDQITTNIRQFAQVGSIVGHADKSSTLKTHLENGKSLIISTIQKFPFILKEIDELKENSKFAIIIDEAHSSQGGKITGQMNIVLSGNASDDEELSYEELINKIMESRKMLPNADYFAFTATPKNKTLETFGEEYKVGDKTEYRPFHNYSMKQAIEEHFIMDVLKSYTPIQSFYKLVITAEDSQQEFDEKKANKKLRRYVESQEHPIKQKAEIMIDHFHKSVIAQRKIDGQARAMVVTDGIERAIQYYYAFCDYLKEINSPYQPIIAFSGEKVYNGKKLTEAIMNGFPSSDITDKIQEDPYRFLIVADKYQTGYDEPLMHTMYVDKTLFDIKAVQTLSRLNRSHPKKTDTFILDFMNDPEDIIKAFSTYYKTTILSDGTDPNRLNDLQTDLENAQVFAYAQIEKVVEMFLGGADRDRIDAQIDLCVNEYEEHLSEDEQIDFKSKAKMFNRAYNFLAPLLPYTNARWEKLSIFLNFLIPKLPSPKEEDLSKGILETIDLESYRASVKATMSIALPDEDAIIDPVQTEAGGKKQEPEMNTLEVIVNEFNRLWGDINWKDEDKIQQVICEEIPNKVLESEAYQNAMKNSSKQNAKIEHDKALAKIIREMLFDHAELAKLFSENEDFRRWLIDMSFDKTYKKAG